MWDGIETSRLPCDIPCVSGVKDLTPEKGPFPPPCLGPQDTGIYLMSPTLEEGRVWLSQSHALDSDIIFVSWQVQHWSGQSGGTYEANSDRCPTGRLQEMIGAWVAGSQPPKGLDWVLGLRLLNTCYLASVPHPVPHLSLSPIV